jgi:hypothetical protein
MDLNLILRSIKGSSLTHLELDENFQKLENAISSKFPFEKILLIDTDTVLSLEEHNNCIILVVPSDNSEEGTPVQLTFPPLDPTNVNSKFTSSFMFFTVTKLLPPPDAIPGMFFLGLRGFNSAVLDNEETGEVETRSICSFFFSSFWGVDFEAIENAPLGFKSDFGDINMADVNIGLCHYVSLPVQENSNNNNSNGNATTLLKVGGVSCVMNLNLPYQDNDDIKFGFNIWDNNVSPLSTYINLFIDNEDGSETKVADFNGSMNNINLEADLSYNSNGDNTYDPSNGNSRFQGVFPKTILEEESHYRFEILIMFNGKYVYNSSIFETDSNKVPVNSIGINLPLNQSIWEYDFVGINDVEFYASILGNNSLNSEIVQLTITSSNGIPISHKTILGGVEVNIPILKGDGNSIYELKTVSQAKNGESERYFSSNIGLKWDQFLGFNPAMKDPVQAISKVYFYQ